MTSPATCDTSVLVAALISWHPLHRTARRALPRVSAIASHVLLECYSVVTRLPAPHRLSAAAAAEALQAVDLELLALPLPQQHALIGQLAGAAVRGGACYDGLIAATARHHDLPLLTADRRARATYESLGTRYELL